MKHTKQQENSQQSGLLKPLTLLSSLSAKITLKFGFIWREFVESYKQNLVKEAKKQNPSYSTVELAGRTGIDRRYIAEYLKTDEVKLKPTKVQLTLRQIKMQCERNNVESIKKSGPFQSFESICLQTAHGTLTPNSIAKELIRQGNIKDCGDHYKLVNWSYTPDHKNLNASFRLLSQELDRLTDTYISNTQYEEKIKRKYQRNIYSSQIPPEKFAQIETEISALLKSTLKEVDDVLCKYEENVPENTYPIYGASMFSFGPDHNIQEPIEHIEKETEEK